MGLVGKLLSFSKTALSRLAKVNPGGGYNVTADHFSCPGDDSQPLAGDYVAMSSTRRSGVYVAIGYLDTQNLLKAEAGEKRIYARESSGAQVCEVWLKSDGQVVIQNGNCSFEVSPEGTIKGSNHNGIFRLDEGGDFVVNNVVIDPAGNITTPEKIQGEMVEAVSSLKVAAKELDGHVHGGVTVGSGSTGAF